MAQRVFDEASVASVVDSAGFDRAEVWFQESPLRIDYLIDRPDIGEESGFVGGPRLSGQTSRARFGRHP